MRIALVSAIERTSNDELRAEQQLAGRSVLEWQIDLALKLRCERVICLCMVPASELIIEQQRRVERAGASFHALRNHMQLTNLVRGEDQLFVQLDGLIIDQDALDEDLEANGDLQNSIFELDADHSLSAAYPSDFERIDGQKHWGGVAVLPGECAGSLKEMPDDADAVSLLLRIGLQARVARENVPALLLENNQWVLASDRESLDLRSKALMEASLPEVNWAGPGAGFATTIVRLSASRWLGSGSKIAAALAVTGMVIAAGLAGFGFGVSGLALASLSTFSAFLAKGSSSLRSGISGQPGKDARLRWLTLAVTALACAVLVLANLGASDWQSSIAIPLFALGLSNLAAHERQAQIQAFWRDTPSHFAIFAVCAAFGFLHTALLVFALGALFQLLLRAYKK